MTGSFDHVSAMFREWGRMTSSTSNYRETCMQVSWQVNGKRDDHPHLCLHLYHL